MKCPVCETEFEGSCCPACGMDSRGLAVENGVPPEDPLFTAAVEVVLDAGAASTGLLQRRCKLGYARASQIIDEMERQGIVGPYEGARPRKVLLSRLEWAQLHPDLYLSQEVAIPPTPAPTLSATPPPQKKNRKRYSIKDCDFMEGHQFEYLCADVLRKNGYQNVQVTQGSGDYGIDVLAEKDGKSYAIQCKCYSSPVGNRAVQEAFSGAAYYNRQIPVVMTNQTFTAAAIKTANKTGVVLWGRDVLKRMLENDISVPAPLRVLKSVLRYLIGRPAAIAATLIVIGAIPAIYEDYRGVWWQFVPIIMCIWLILRSLLVWVGKKLLK